LQYLKGHKGLAIVKRNLDIVVARGVEGRRGRNQRVLVDEDHGHVHAVRPADVDEPQERLAVVDKLGAKHGHERLAGLGARVRLEVVHVLRYTIKMNALAIHSWVRAYHAPSARPLWPAPPAS